MRLSGLTMAPFDGVAAGRRIIRRDGRIVSASDLASRSWWHGPSLHAALASGDLSGGRHARSLRLRMLSGSILAVPLMVSAGVARAQAIQPLVTPTIEPDYNRGRNISVNEMYDPNYDALGVRFGSIVAFPSIGVITGVTTNVYANNDFKREDGYYIFQPAVRVTTDLPVHKVTVIANADIQRYAHETLRNQNPYNVLAEGQLDLGSDLQVIGRVQYSRSSESPYTTDLASNISVLSEYTRFVPSLSVVYKVGRMRITGKVDRTELGFKPITFQDGTVRSQRDRDRTLDRASIQAEYALSPSIAVFGQANLDKTVYPQLDDSGTANRGSKGGSFLAGFNFDLAGLMRGSIAGGYVKREYKSAAFNDGDGFLWQIQTEFFVSPLTTVGVGAQRLIQDSNLTNDGAYSDIRATVAVDHALLRNLVISGNFSVVKQERLNTHTTSRFTSGGVSGRYQSNRFVTVGGNIQYARGRPGVNAPSVPFDEVRGQVFVRFRR